MFNCFNELPKEVITKLNNVSLYEMPNILSKQFYCKEDEQLFDFVSRYDNCSNYFPTLTGNYDTKIKFDSSYKTKIINDFEFRIGKMDIEDKYTINCLRNLPTVGGFDGSLIYECGCDTTCHIWYEDIYMFTFVKLPHYSNDNEFLIGFFEKFTEENYQVRKDIKKRICLNKKEYKFIGRDLPQYKILDSEYEMFLTGYQLRNERRYHYNSKDEYSNRPVKRYIDHEQNQRMCEYNERMRSEMIERSFLRGGR